ncbi:MAG: hypothetical protein R6V15_04110 [Desulfotignum sp.]
MEEQDRLQTFLMDIAARDINIELAEVKNVLTRARKIKETRLGGMS